MFVSLIERQNWMLTLHKLTALVVMCFLIWLVWFQNAWEQCCGVWEWIVMCVLRTLSFSVNTPQWPLEAWQGLSAQGCSVFLLDPPISSAGWRTDGSRLLFSGSVTSTFFTAVCKEAINIRSQHKYLSRKALSPSVLTVHSAALKRPGASGVSCPASRFLLQFHSSLQGFLKVCWCNWSLSNACPYKVLTTFAWLFWVPQTKSCSFENRTKLVNLLHF